MNTFSLVLLAVVTSACFGPRAPTVNVADLTTEQQAAVARVTVFDRTQLATADYRALGPVESLSCRNKAWDRGATVEDALHQLRYWVSIRQGNAMTDVHCGRQGTSTTPNCWESVHCVGEALAVRATLDDDATARDR